MGQFTERVPASCRPRNPKRSGGSGGIQQIGGDLARAASKDAEIFRRLAQYHSSLYNSRSPVAACFLTDLLGRSQALFHKCSFIDIREPRSTI